MSKYRILKQKGSIYWSFIIWRIQFCHLWIWFSASCQMIWLTGKQGKRLSSVEARRGVERGKPGAGEMGNECAWMLSAAAEWHFIAICQLNSDWPDTANPPRCSALTDECVTVLHGRKWRGGLRLLWPEGPGKAGPLRDHCPRDLGRFGRQDDPASGN